MLTRIFTIVCLSFAPIVSKAAIPQKINSGDTVYSILKKNSFKTDQVNSILADKAIPNHFTLVPGKKYYVYKKNARTEIKFYDPETDNVLTFWKENKKAGGINKPADYDIKVKTIEGRVYGSLITSVLKQVSDKQLAYRFMDAFAFNYNLRRQLQRGDRFKITFEKKYDGERFIKTGEILYAEATIGGRKVTRHFVKHKNGGSFVDANFNQSKRPLYAPADYSSFSSKFSYARKHPVTGRVKAHLGLDYQLPHGANIYAAQAGQVLRFGKHRAAGRYVVIKHADGIETYYNHMSAIDKNVRKGAFIKAGQKIGENGCTGYCTKPHLHFAVKKKGRWVNPIKYVRSYPYHQKHTVKKYIASLN